MIIKATKNDDLHVSFGDIGSRKRIVSIDSEWAKNWKAKEKFIPFCIGIHSIYLDEIGNFLDIDKLHMETELYFRENYESTQDYIENVESILSKYIDDNTLILGHQLNSDLYTFVHCSNKKLNTIEQLIDAFKTRKNFRGADNKKGFTVADTRYDINNRIKGQEKLRSVSLRLNVFAIQNELNEMSLTKMYNAYLLDADQNKKEKLIVLNWRHAFQTALVWLIDTVYPDKTPYNSKFNMEFIVTNDIIFEMGKDHINYINSEEFEQSLSLEGICNYIKKYQPDKINKIGFRL